MVEHGPAGNLSQSEMSAWRCMIRVKQIMVGLCTSAILGLTAGSRSKIPIVWTQRHWSLDRRSVHTFGQSCSTAASEENNGPDMLLSLIATSAHTLGGQMMMAAPVPVHPHGRLEASPLTIPNAPKHSSPRLIQKRRLRVPRFR
jgi:hypothetical protein